MRGSYPVQVHVDLNAAVVWLQILQVWGQPGRVRDSDTASLGCSEEHCFGAQKEPWVQPLQAASPLLGECFPCVCAALLAALLVRRDQVLVSAYQCWCGAAVLQEARKEFGWSPAGLEIPWSCNLSRPLACPSRVGFSMLFELFVTTFPRQ